MGHLHLLNQLGSILVLTSLSVSAEKITVLSCFGSIPSAKYPVVPFTIVNASAGSYQLQ